MSIVLAVGANIINPLSAKGDYDRFNEQVKSLPSAMKSMFKQQHFANFKFGLKLNQKCSQCVKMQILEPSALSRN